MNRFYGALNTIYSKTKADWSAEGSKDKLTLNGSASLWGALVRQVVALITGLGWFKYFSEVVDSYWNQLDLIWNWRETWYVSSFQL